MATVKPIVTYSPRTNKGHVVITELQVKHWQAEFEDKRISTTFAFTDHLIDWISLTPSMAKTLMNEMAPMLDLKVVPKDTPSQLKEMAALKTQLAKAKKEVAALKLKLAQKVPSKR